MSWRGVAGRRSDQRGFGALCAAPGGSSARYKLERGRMLSLDSGREHGKQSGAMGRGAQRREQFVRLLRAAT